MVEMMRRAIPAIATDHKLPDSFFFGDVMVLVLYAI